MINDITYFTDSLLTEKYNDYENYMNTHNKELYLEMPFMENMFATTFYGIRLIIADLFTYDHGIDLKHR
jgi:hypothetical protein